MGFILGEIGRPHVDLVERPFTIPVDRIMLGLAGEFQPSHVKPLFIMKRLLGLISLVAGAALTLAPLLLLLSFSYDVGASPYADPKGFKYFALPLLAGVVLGGGLLLVGLPDLVVGPMRRASRNVAAVLLVASTAALFHIGFSGSVTAVVCPLAIFMNAIAFFYFVYPAKRFSDTGGRPAADRHDDQGADLPNSQSRVGQAPLNAPQ